MFNADTFKWAKLLNAESIKAATKGNMDSAATFQADARTTAMEALFKGTTWRGTYLELHSRHVMYPSRAQEFLNLATTLELAADYLKTMPEWSWLEFDLRRDAEKALAQAIEREAAAA